MERENLRPGRFEEFKQQMKLKQLDILGVCETRWRDNLRMIHSGDKQEKNRIGIILNKEWGLVENIYHVNDRILLISNKIEHIHSKHDSHQGILSNFE